MTKKIAIHWLRQDLRLSDNLALTKAAKHDSVLHIHILDDDTTREHMISGSSLW